MKHVLSHQEKIMVVRVHSYLLKESKEFGFNSKKSIRDRVHECLGVSKSTIAEIIAAYHKDKASFLAGTTQPPPARGKPPTCYNDDTLQLLRNLIDDRKKQNFPITSTILCKELSEKHNFKGSARTIRRILAKAEFQFAKKTFSTPKRPTSASI